MAGNHWHHGPARSSPQVAKSRNVGLLAVIVSPGVRLLARNVSRKCPLFAGSDATVCKPLQLPGQEIKDLDMKNFYVYERLHSP
jgi:hypothetical protein